MAMRIAIVGSAVLSGEEQEKGRKMVNDLVGFLKQKWGDELIIISGRSPKGGIDIYAEEAAIANDVKTEIFPPEVHQWEDDGDKMGYKTRNLAIATRCDRLFCLKSPNSKTNGSGWTADRAAERGKIVVREWIQ